MLSINDLAVMIFLLGMIIYFVWYVFEPIIGE